MRKEKSLPSGLKKSVQDPTHPLPSSAMPRGLAE